MIDDSAKDRDVGVADDAIGLRNQKMKIDENTHIHDSFIL